MYVRRSSNANKALIAAALVLLVYLHTHLFSLEVDKVKERYQSLLNKGSGGKNDTGSSVTPYTFEGLNRIVGTSEGFILEERVLILTPFKQAAKDIEPYWKKINTLSYPHRLISLGFLVSDSSDNTIELLQNTTSDFTQYHSIHDPTKQFSDVQIYKKDFGYSLSGDERHEYFRQDLISLNKDIIVPNCMYHKENGEDGGYDRNNWWETPESMELQSELSEEAILIEGYEDHITHRALLVDYPDNAVNRPSTGRFHAIELEGVGATSTLVRANVHRAGAIFPAFVFQHAIETEGLAKVAKGMGFSVWGLPNYKIYHS